MKKNRFILIAVGILAILALVLVLTNTTSTIRGSSTEFALDDTANVTRIFMSDKNNNTLSLSKKGSGDWIVNDRFAASRFNVGMLLQTMLEIEVSSPVAKAARNNVIRQMAANCVKVEIYQEVFRIDLFGRIRLFPHEKLTRVYYVGGATQSNRGSYFLMEGSEEPYVVFLPGLRGFVTPRYMPIEKYWRDYTVIKKTLQEIRTVQVELPSAPEQSFIIRNSKSFFSFLSLTGQQVQGRVDTLAVMNFLNGFRNLNYEVLLNDLDPVRKDSILDLPPFVNITVTDTAGVTTVIKTFRRPAEPGATDMNGKPLPYDMDRFYALINGGQDLVLAQFYVFDRVLRPKSFFLKENKK
jgi:hypothetical protein